MFSQKLKELRKTHNLSMDEFVDKYNRKFDGKLNKSTVSRYENNLQEPMINVVKNIAAFFNVSLDYLTNESSNDDFDVFSVPNIHPIKLKKFPLLGEIACGEPIFADEDKENYIMADHDIKADFCLVAKGDSMINARIFDGDTVFIKKQPIVDNGEIAAVIIDDEATLKRVYYDKESNVLTLMAENPKFKSMVFTDSELDTIRILGKAVYFTSMVI